MKLLAIGDNVVDFYEEQNIIYPGGNALNVAVIGKQNGAEKTAYLGIVGDDFEANHVVETLKQNKINIDRIRKAYGPNGKAYVALDEHGDRIFKGTNKTERVQSQLTLQLTNEDMDYLAEYDVIHTSINSHIEHLLPLLKEKLVSFDFSTKNKWDDAYLQSICPYVDMAFFSGSDMNETDIQRLTEQVHALGVAVIVVTRGEKGAIGSAQGEHLEQKPKLTNVVDTMGAGDSFIAGFITSYANKKNLKQALQQGAASAARTCTTYGAFGCGSTLQTM